jgi:hypothetical protein
MRDILLVAIVATTVVSIGLIELIAAVVPLVLVVLMVPPEQRQDLATVIAAADSSHRLRLWPALRIAVRVRRNARAKAATIRPR